ncbi:threonine synthase [Thermococcus sp. 4557]|uniref:pyridoxal-phosphate dependent enzyme n=1 Tax=Thermococcus sp. (strain CGMCC 1.5172 / 4557) TaxID=1042877 RepID=UPI000219EBD6|nr:pyridoxal-phosphate dependent enzyme [Thermococcus sp. 4557]AEK72818.1 threonine synthase [Thermococcus sp. 4557]
MLVCSHCGKGYPETFRLTCDCGGTLLVKRNHTDFFGSLRPHIDMRRYLNLLPVNEDYIPPATPAITPVSTLPIGQVSGFFKLEYLQPSGSFKDRGTWVTVAKLREEGITEVVLDSSGNAALSFALYGLASGIRVHTFVSYDTLPGKLSLLQRLGAVIHFVDGDRMTVHGRAVEFAEKSGITYVSHWLNPYFLEGTKTAAFEVYEQLGVPDYVIAPAGSGTLFLGLWKGFSELKGMGEIEELPTFVAVQASGYESLCERSSVKSRLAEGIAIPEPPRLEEMKAVLDETGGTCVSVEDSEIERALEWLWGRGFIVEPTSATVLAALWKLQESGFIPSGSGVLLPLTGSGLKMVEGI